MLDAVGIITSDIDKAKEFYGLLGLDIKAFPGSEGHYEDETKSGIRVMFDSEELVQKVNPNWQKPTGNSIVLCFKQESPEKVNQIYTQLVEMGYQSEKEPWDAFWGQRYACVKDFDGHQVDLFANLT